MKKKKWIIIVVAVIIVFAIIGASGSNDEKDSKQADNSVTKVANTTPPATAAPDTSSEDSTDSETESDAPLIFKEGETASKNGIEITMTKVTESKGKGYNKPAKGKIFVICNFLVENKSDDDFTMSMLDYNAYADGYSLSETYYSEDDFGSMSGTIAPGKKMKGALAFEVKKDYKKLELDFALGDLFGDEKVKFVNKK